MKKKILLIILGILFIFVYAFHEFLENKYSMNIMDYLKNAKPLTVKEKQWLKDHGKIIYGADENAPPLRYVDEKSKQYKGLVVDYMNALSVEIGSEIEFKPLVWEDALRALSNGNTDICDMFKSPKRKENYLFSDPIYKLRGVIAVSKKEDTIYNYRNLNGKRVGIQKGDYSQEFLKVNVKDCQYIFTRNIKEALFFLEKNKVDAVVGDEPVVSYFIEKYNLKDKVKLVEYPIYEEDVVLAIPKSKPALLSIVNKGIYNLKKRNFVEKLQQKWFGISVPISKNDENYKLAGKIVFALMGIFSLLFYLFYSWNKTLKIEVEKRTKELANSKNELQATFDGMNHFMIVVDKDFYILNVNESFCLYIQMEREEIVGKRMEEMGDILKVLWEEGIKEYKELLYKEKIFEITVISFEDHVKHGQNTLLMIQDITKEKIKEKQLLQGNKMAAIGQLAAGVAHEIRNPLGIIRNYSYLLKKSKITLNEMGIKAISSIEESVERAGNIIDNLLNFSRISGDKNTWVNLKALIESILKLEEKVIKDATIKAFVECEKSLICYSNEEALKHILINLISNSIDAMEEGGDLTIRCEKKESLLFIECMDTGKGIEKENMEHIFHPFFTTKPAGKGTGLGLYIVYNEVEKLGGDIKVYSTGEGGTIFTIILPLKEEDI